MNVQIRRLSQTFSFALLWYLIACSGEQVDQLGVVRQAATHSDSDSLEDRFDHSDGSFPANGWERVSGSQSDWSVSSGGLDRADVSGTSIIVNGQSGWEDYTFEAKVKLRSDSSKKIGAVVRFQDANNYYNVEFNAGKLKFKRKVAGVWKTLQSADFDAAFNTYHLVKVVLSGSSIQCFVDAEQLIDVVDDSLSAGRVGLKSNGESRFDQVKTYDVSDGPPVPNADAFVVSRTSSDDPDFLCDGNDDQVQINQAIEQAASASHQIVELRAGTYTVSGNVYLKPGVTLRGAGSITIIKLEDNAPDLTGRTGIIRIKDDDQFPEAAKRVDNVTLEDFVVDGNRANQSAEDEKKYGLYAEGDNITLRGLTIKNCAGYGFDPHATDDTIASSNMLIENCEAYGNALDGFTLDMVQDSVFRNNYAHDNDRHGINLVTDTQNVLITGATSSNNGSNGLTAQNGATAVTIVDSVFEDNGLRGLYLRACDDTEIVSNQIRGNSREGISLRGSDDNVVRDNTLVNNSTFSSSYAEIALDDYNGDNSSGNDIDDNSITSINANSGVKERGTANNNSVTGNTIDVSSNHVVLIGSGSTQSGNTLQ